MDILKAFCPLCLEKYDLDNHVPRIVHCGATICTACLLGFIRENKPIACPHDKKVFQPPQSINQALINHGLKEIIQMTQSCQIIYSQTQANTSQRMNNSIPSLKMTNSYSLRSDDKNEAEKMARDLEESSKELKKYKDNLQNFFVQKKQSSLKMTKDRFISLKKFIAFREEQILSEISNFFDNQISELNKHAGSSSITENTLREKIYSLKNSRQTPNLENFLSQDMSQAINNLNPKFLQQRIQATKNQLETDLRGFDDQLTELGNTVLNLHFPQELIGEKVAKIFLGKNQTGRALGSSRFMASCGEIKTMSEDDTLVLSTSNLQTLQKENELYFQNNVVPEWKNKRMVCLNLSKEMLDQRKLFDLASVLSSKTNTTGLRLNFNYKTMSDDALSNVSPFICWNLKGVTSINICLQFCKNISDRSITTFFSYLFPQMCNLKHLHIDLRGTKVTDKTFEALSGCASNIFKYLESCEVLLCKTFIMNEGVKNLFRPMERLESYKVDLQGTKITGEGIKQLAVESLPTMKALLNLELSLADIGIDDEGVIELLRRLNKLKRLALNLSNTLISDKTLEAFTMWCLSSLCSLESLDLDLRNTQVTDFGVVQLISSLYNIKALKLNLMSTKTTNKVAGALKKNNELLRRLETLEILIEGASIRNLSDLI